MKKITAIASLAAVIAGSPASAQEDKKPEFPSPNAIVDKAAPKEWRAIAASDLLVMDLIPDAAGKTRRVIIQLMPEPFSQGWIGNIRKLAKAQWWDGTSINRVQDNYVVQWGDASEKKALPEGLEVMTEKDYVVDGDTLSGFTEDREVIEPDPKAQSQMEKLLQRAADPKLTDKQYLKVVDALMKITGLAEAGEPTSQERIALISIESTQTEITSQGWHERDGHAKWVEFWKGWPLANFIKSKWENEDGQPIPRPANTQRHVLAKQQISEQIEENNFWPIHCYGAVGVGRGYSPDTGTGAELYTVIGHAPRHLDRNIAVVGRIVEGIEHLSSLPRGTGSLGFYEKAEQRVPIQSIRTANEMAEADQPRFEYLDTDGKTFAKYIDARANRRDPFFIAPAGGADICNIPVPVRRVKGK